MNKFIKKMNWRVAGLLAVIVITAIVLTLANVTTNTTSSLYVKGKAIDAKQGTPVVRAGVIYVPIEPIVKGMGDTFTYTEQPNSATISKQDGTQITITMNSNNATVNGTSVPVSDSQVKNAKVPTKAKLIVVNNKLYAPLDFISNVLKYPVESETKGTKVYVYVDGKPVVTPSPSPSSSTTTPAGGKLDLPYKTPDGWVPPQINAVATDNLDDNNAVLEDQLDFNMYGYSPYGKDAFEGTDAILVSGGKGYLTSLQFNYWYGSKNDVDIGNKVPYIARELFKFYLPNKYETLFKIMSDGYSGKDVSQYINSPFTLDNRQILIVDKPDSVVVYISKLGGKVNI